jgi:hypothetical protein
MNHVFLSSRLKAAAFTFCLTFSAFGQIVQKRPEICGSPGGVVPVPPAITAISDRSQGISQLSLKIGDSVASLQLSAIAIEQVCPLPQGKLLVVGETGGADNVNIVSQTTGALLDSFYAWDPVISPDQHWLIMRKFYPVHMDVPYTEEYLLYDLTKDKAGNRLSGVSLDDSEEVGRTVYPVGLENTVGDNTNVPEDKTHRFYSDSFYWAPDSKAVVFADNLQGTLSIVLVTVNGNETKTYVHPVTMAEGCGDPSKPNTSTYDIQVSHPEAGAQQGTDREIRIPIRASAPVCKVTGVILHSEDFQPAKVESYPPHQFPPSVRAPEP